MPTRIFAGVGDHPCFLTINCKITNFSSYLFVWFLKRSPQLFLGVLNKLLLENLLASMLCIHTFPAHYAVLYASLQTIQPLRKTWNARLSKCVPQFLV